MLSGSSVEEGEYVVLLHLVVVVLLFISQNIKSHIYYHFHYHYLYYLFLLFVARLADPLHRTRVHLLEGLAGSRIQLSEYRILVKT